MWRKRWLFDSLLVAMLARSLTLTMKISWQNYYCFLLKIISIHCFSSDWTKKYLHYKSKKRAGFATVSYLSMQKNDKYHETNKLYVKAMDKVFRFEQFEPGTIITCLVQSWEWQLMLVFTDVLTIWAVAV